ncbi:MAG: ABC transporter substrate-binding protein [Deltaproteobacteria bacterium]|nr:ABC transporter substrate-binding protein [Deltaproteobacteria bacterium]
MKVKLTISAVLVWLTTLSPLAAPAQTSRSLYVGLVSITPSNSSVLAAVDGGYFKKHGLEVKPIVMAGSTTAIAAMLSGEVNFITIAASGLINAHLAGRDAVMIAGIVNFAPYELIVGRGIERLEDLKGKRVGIARFGGSADFLARWGLEKNGLRPGKDLLEQAFAHQAKKAGFRSLLDYAAAGLDYQHSAIGTTKSFIDKNREVVGRFMKGLVEGTHRFKTDAAFGRKVIERHLKVSDSDTISAAYDYYSSKTDLVPYVPQGEKRKTGGCRRQFHRQRDRGQRFCQTDHGRQIKAPRGPGLRSRTSLSATEGSASEAADVRLQTARLMARTHRPQPRARFPRELTPSAVRAGTGTASRSQSPEARSSSSSYSGFSSDNLTLLASVLG